MDTIEVNINRALVTSYLIQRNNQDTVLWRSREVLSQVIESAFKRATDFTAEKPTMSKFISTFQGTLLYTITSQTELEIVVNRLSAKKPRCGMTVDVPVTLANLKIAMNYLDDKELRQFINLGSTYLLMLENLEIQNIPVDSQRLIKMYYKVAEMLGYSTVKAKETIAAGLWNDTVEKEFTLYQESIKKQLK